MTNDSRSTLVEQIEQTLAHFKYDHLPDHLKAVSAPFWDLAYRLVSKGPHADLEPVKAKAIPSNVPADFWNWEHLHMLRDLLKAKDAAVRAEIKRLSDIHDAVNKALLRFQV